MSKMLVVVFDEESKAFEGVRALWQLHREGSISAYAGAVVARNSDGSLSVKDEVDEGPIGAAVGMMIGSLIGVLAGPAGVLIGAAGGGLLGSMSDIVNLGVGVDFLDEVGGYLAPGKVAVVAEVEEAWVTPVDTRMEELGGVVFRRWRADVEDEQIEREIAATNAEFKELKAEYHEAVAENKAKLQAKVDKAREKLKAAGDRVKAKLESLKQESEAKVKAVQDQIATATAEKKDRLEKRVAEIKSEYEVRKGKLQQARQLTKEAIAG